MKDEQAVISAEKLTLCRDCKNGEKDEFFPKMVFCRLTRRWMNGTGFCSDGNRMENKRVQTEVLSVLRRNDGWRR